MFDLNKIKKNILLICDYNDDITEEQIKKSVFWYFKNEITIYLNKNTLTEYNNALNEANREPNIKNNFPDIYIRTSIENIITETIKQPKNERPFFLENKLEELKNELKCEINEYELIFHINGLYIEESIFIGDIEFFKLEYPELKILDKKLEYSKFIIKGTSSDFLISGHTYAKIKCKGVRQFAYDTAISKIRNAINIIKFIFYGNNRKEDFGLDYDILPNKYRISIIKIEPEFNPNYQINLVGKSQRYQLDKKYVKKMNDSLDAINKILNKKSNPSKLENRILTAIYWFGEAISIQNHDNKGLGESKSKHSSNNLIFVDRGEKLLKLFFALESLLNFNNEFKDEPITQNISERTSILITADLKTRDRIKITTEELYGLRSKLVHQGGTYVEKSHLKDLTYYTYYTIMQILYLNENGTNTIKSLLSHIENKKFINTTTKTS